MDYELAAKYYDRYVKWDGDVPFFLKETAETTGETLELMSGTGRLSLPLIEAGVKLTCVDNSSAMLRLLQEKLAKRGLTASVIQQNVCALELGKMFELIILPFHSFAEIVNGSDQKAALNAIYEHLSGKGRFVCTLHNPKTRLKSVNSELRLIARCPPEAEEPILFVWSTDAYNPETRVVEGTQIYEEHDARGVLLSRSEMPVKFCLHERKQFEKLAADSGFKVRNLYGDYAYSPFNEESSPVMVFELGKQAV